MAPEHGTWRRRLLADGRWKLAALVAATLVFYAVRSRISYTSTVTVPVEVEREPGLAVLSAEPFSVRVTFRGAFADVQALNNREMRVRLKPHAGASGGSERVRVRSGDIRDRQPGARVTDIQPSTVLLTFDRQGQVVLPLAEPVVEGKPLRGRVELDYAPRTVTVNGAQRQLEAMKEQGYRVQTEPVDVDGRVQSFTKTVRLVPPAGVWQADLAPPQATVKVNIVTEQSTRELRDLPVLAVAPAGRRVVWQVAPAAVLVRLTGRAEVVQAVDADAATVFVDARKLGPGEVALLPVRIHLPPEVALDAVAAEPSAVLVSRGEE